MSLGTLGAGGAYCPVAIPGTVGWFDAQQETFADGDAVGTWTDRATTPHNLTQPIAGGKPTFKKTTNGINGFNALSFDGGDAVGTANNAFTNFTNGTYYIVFRTGASVASIYTLFAGVNAALNAEVLLYYQAGVMKMYAGSVVGTGTVVANTNYIACFQFNGASSFIRINGSQSANVNPGSNNIASWRSGANATPGAFMLGLIGEIVARNVVDTAPEIAYHETSMKRKWGI